MGCRKSCFYEAINIAASLLKVIFQCFLYQVLISIWNTAANVDVGVLGMALQVSIKNKLLNLDQEL